MAARDVLLVFVVLVSIAVIASVRTVLHEQRIAT
jgi:hypothetical protein